jgi:hypothetical protein
VVTKWISKPGTDGKASTKGTREMERVFISNDISQRVNLASFRLQRQDSKLTSVSDESISRMQLFVSRELCESGVMAFFNEVAYEINMKLPECFRLGELIIQFALVLSQKPPHDKAIDWLPDCKAIGLHDAPSPATFSLTFETRINVMFLEVQKITTDRVEFRERIVKEFVEKNSEELQRLREELEKNSEELQRLRGEHGIDVQQKNSKLAAQAALISQHERAIADLEAKLNDAGEQLKGAAGKLSSQELEHATFVERWKKEVRVARESAELDKAAIVKHQSTIAELTRKLEEALEAAEQEKRRYATIEEDFKQQLARLQAKLKSKRTPNEDTPSAVPADQKYG